jgi:hypothetical protein
MNRDDISYARALNADRTEVGLFTEDGEELTRVSPEEYVAEYSAVEGEDLFDFRIESVDRRDTGGEVLYYDDVFGVYSIVDFRVVDVVRGPHVDGERWLTVPGKYPVYTSNPYRYENATVVQTYGFSEEDVSPDEPPEAYDY